MAIADEKIKASSSRHMLVKVTPAKYVGSDLSLDGGVIYSMTQVEPIEKVERNGTALTNVSTASVTADQWHHDEATNVLYVGLASAPHESTNVVIAFFNLFLTGEKHRYISEDPLNSATTVRDWQPLIRKFPSLSESIKDVTNGVFSISSFSLDLIDTDLYLKGLLNTEATFNNADVTVWTGINTVIEKTYLGKVKSVGVSSSSVKLKVLDAFSPLGDSATMGDSESEIYATVENYPNIDGSLEGKAIPIFFGETSFSKIIEAAQAFGPSKSTVFLEANVGINIDFSTSVGSSWNNIFILGRVGPSGVAMQNVGTISSVYRDGSGNNQTSIRFVTTGHNMKIGDAFRARSADAAIIWNLAVREIVSNGFITDARTYSRNTPFPLLGDDFTGDFDAHPITPASTFYLNKSVQVIVTNSDTSYSWSYSAPVGYEPASGYITETATADGNKLVTIDLSKVGPTHYLGTAGSTEKSFNPTTRKLLFTLTPNDSASHSDTVKGIVERSGAATNTASFTQAQTDLASNCLFQIPFIGETTYPSYLKVLEKIMESVLGVLYIDENLEVNYKIIAAPAAGTSIGEALTIEGSTSADIDYQDIITTFKGENKHYNRIASAHETDDPFFYLENTKAKHLNKSEKIKEIDHVMQGMASRAQDILNLLSQRRMTYNIAVATELIDANLADDITLAGKILIGTSATENIKIVSIKKSPEKITIKATDLKGI